MQRYFVATDQFNDGFVRIIGEDVKHITKVMRMNKGDEIICINASNGQVFACELEQLNQTEVVAKIVQDVEENRELPVKITIAQALPKGDKLDLIVQKGTELGASAFIPFSAKRSIVKWDEKKATKKIERLSKIAKEAAEQSYRQHIPTIYDCISFNHLLNKSEEYDYKIIAYEEEAKSNRLSNLGSLLSSINDGSTALVIIGPEGGLSSEEVEALKAQGFISCSFGPRILRTETAALYFLSAASYQFEMLR